MMKCINFLILTFYFSLLTCEATTYNIVDCSSTVDTGLINVLGKVNGGDIVNLPAGNITCSSSIVTTRSGTSGSHITWQAASYRGSTITFTAGNLIRVSGDYWDIKNIVFDGNSVAPSNEAPLTIGRTDGTVSPNDITITGVRIRKSGAAGLMINENSSNITVSDLHVDGTGYASIHGEGIYVGSVGGVAVSNISVSDSLFEDDTENIIDVHPNVSNCTFTRILGRNQTSCAARNGGTCPYGTENARTSIVVNSGSSATFTDVTLQNNNAGENVFDAGTTAGTVTFTRLIVQTSTTNSSLLSPDGSAFTMTGSEFWNVNNTTVNASTGSGTQSITTTCGTSKSGTGNSLTCATPATPKFWQRQESFTASATSLAKAYTLNVTAGSILTAEVVSGADISATASASDNRNGAWSYGYNSGGKLNFFYKTNAAAGATTVTVATGAGATSLRMKISEYRGVDANTVLASSSTGTPGTGATLSSGNVTTGQDSNLLVQTCGADAVTTLTKDSNFTLRFFNGGDTLLSADRVPATGTYASTCTQSGSATIRSGIANFGPPTATGTIEVGSIPNLEDGATFTISWSSTGLSENVDVFISRDGGTTWEKLVDNTADDGAYDWTVAGGSSSNCKFKVAGHTSTTVYGVSNTFRKKGKYL